MPSWSQVIRRPGQARYDGILDCAAKIYRDEGGLRAFWKGNLANKIKSTPQFGITLVLYEIIQRVFFVDFGGSKPSGSCRERVGAEVRPCPRLVFEGITPWCMQVLPSSHPDHIGGFSVAQPIFVGMESKFGLFFPKFRHKETWCQNGDGEWERRLMSSFRNFNFQILSYLVSVAWRRCIIFPKVVSRSTADGGNIWEQNGII